MLTYFPQVREEESTYSIFSKLQFALQMPNKENLGIMLFNRKTEVGRLNFQTSFDYLSEQLKYKHSTEKFLYRHTILPIFLPFITPEKLEKVKKYFSGDYPDKVHKTLKVHLVTNTRNFVRFCKECVKEDIREYGEPCYKRQHEIELNRMCSKHNIALSEYVIFPYRIPCWYTDIYTALDKGVEIPVPDKYKDRFLDIAQDIAFLFSVNLKDFNIYSTLEKLKYMLMKKGYTNSRGFIHQKKFNEDFKNHYTEEFLKYINYDFDIDNNDNWVKNAFRDKCYIQDPMKYLLIIRYLFGSFRAFYEFKEQRPVFNKPPYPCLNPACSDFKQLVIDKFTLTMSHGKPLGTFKCEKCGYTYSRRGPDKDENSIYKKTYVKDYGHIWDDALAKLIKEKKSMRYIGKALNCSLQAIKYHAAKLDLYDELPAETENKYKDYDFSNSLKGKDKPLKALEKSQKEYLLGKDKQERFWDDKDAVLAQKLLDAISAIRNEREPHQRITIDLLQKHINTYNLYINKDRLSRCSRILDEACETLEEYQKRRVDYAVKYLKSEARKVTKYGIYRITGLGPNRGNEKVQEYINQIVQSYLDGEL